MRASLAGSRGTRSWWASSSPPPLQLVSIPAFAALSDRLGRRPVYLAGALFLGLFAFPFFWLVDSGVPVLIWLALVLALTGVAAMYGPQAAFFSELFGTNVRYSGASLGSQLAAPFAGGLAPLIATALLDWSGGQPWPVALYMIGMVLITFSSVFWPWRRYRRTFRAGSRSANREGGVPRAGWFLRLPGDRDRYIGRVDYTLTVLTRAMVGWRCPWGAGERVPLACDERPVPMRNREGPAGAELNREWIPQ